MWSWLQWIKDKIEPRVIIMATTNIETQRAKVAYDFWTTNGFTRNHTLAMMSMEQGESDFKPDAKGDKVGGVAKAFGIFQWHLDRVLLMRDGDTARHLPGCGIDVRTAQHYDQLRAALHELTKGGEQRACKMIKATNSLEDAVRAGIKYFERSGHQESDFEKRIKYAQHWASVIPDKGTGVPNTPVA